MHKNDQELIAESISGNDEAFPELLSRYIKPIYNFSRRLSGSPADAEDISQEVFVKVWKNLKKYRPGESVKTWIFTIARNTAIDWLRKRRHLMFSDFERDGGENPFIENLTDTEILQDERYAQAEDREALESAVSRLSLPHREVLVLHYTLGLTFDEIGKILGEPLHTVKSRHQRAILALREIMKAPK